ncbi:hypothetical protein KFK09_010840 [Dendrobium nobile]|uniref:Uncharacterized protein n=1 Tax=Dendrobium nobile TaxID=94219 RepID=A0A8T3BB23_DENNO|nr:hypothetical protein KFK09_010840 [Dendrobium nobile]
MQIIELGFCYCEINFNTNLKYMVVKFICLIWGWFASQIVLQYDPLIKIYFSGESCFLIFYQTVLALQIYMLRGKFDVIYLVISN